MCVCTVCVCACVYVCGCECCHDKTKTSDRKDLKLGTVVVLVSLSKPIDFHRAMLCVGAVFAVARVRPSVRLSVTFVYCIQTAEVIIKLLSRPGSPVILIFWLCVAIPNSKENPVSWDATYTVGGKILRFSTEITVYLRNSTRWTHGYYGTYRKYRWRINTCRFQWP